MYSDYIIYVDESGDHSLASIDPNYPMFVLAGCIIRKDEYQAAVNDLLRLKFQTFGYDTIVFHDREIRKALGAFSFLTDSTKREAFYEQISAFIGGANFTLVAAAIHKLRLAHQYMYPDNPYEIALTMCLERAYRFLRERGQHEHITHVIVESRGKREDADLELAFRRACDGNNMLKVRMPFVIQCCSKQTNSTGLQLADLVARQIGQHVLNPHIRSRAFEVIRPKFRCSPTGDIHGWGLKIFP